VTRRRRRSSGASRRNDAAEFHQENGFRFIQPVRS
jgi:hypothetical protein